VRRILVIRNGIRPSTSHGIRIRLQDHFNYLGCAVTSYFDYGLTPLSPKRRRKGSCVSRRVDDGGQLSLLRITGQRLTAFRVSTFASRKV
jgi:hypothetical protein